MCDLWKIVCYGNSTKKGPKQKAESVNDHSRRAEQAQICFIGFYRFGDWGELGLILPSPPPSNIYKVGHK